MGVKKIEFRAQKRGSKGRSIPIHFSRGVGRGGLRGLQPPPTKKKGEKKRERGERKKERKKRKEEREKRN